MPTFGQCPRCFYPCWHAWTPWKMWNYQFAENSFDSNMVSGFVKRFLKISTFTESTLMWSWMRKPDCRWEQPLCLDRWKLFGSQNIGIWEYFNVGIVIHSKRKSLGIDQCNLYCHQFYYPTNLNRSQPIWTDQNQSLVKIAPVLTWFTRTGTHYRLLSLHLTEKCLNLKI